MSEAHAPLSVPSNRIDGRIPPELLVSCPLFYFDLAPVLERAGPTMLRNPNRLEIVCDHCVKSVTTTDDAIFAGTGFYLIVTSCEEPQASQLARKISASLLKCFFGTVSASTETLAALFRTPSHEEIAQLERNSPAREIAFHPDAVLRSEPKVKQDIVDQVAAAAEELASEGIERRAGFRFGFVPVHDLRKGTLPSFFGCTMRLPGGEIVDRREGFASTDASDYPRFDQAMLLYALSFGRSLNHAGIVAAVSASVSFETLAWSKGRQYYQNALRATGCAANSSIIVTIDMVPSGTPPTRLADLIAAIRPCAKRVFLQIPEKGLAAIEAANLGAAGYILSARPGTTSAELVAQSMRLAKICNQQGALSCIAGVPDLRIARLVQAAGVRLAAGDFYGSKVFFANTPREKIKAYQAEQRDLRVRAG